MRANVGKLKAEGRRQKAEVKEKGKRKRNL